MSKKLLSLAVIASLTFVTSSFAQQVPNSSFETWGAGPLGDDPVSWGTPNIFSNPLLGSSGVSVTKNTTNFHTGSAAMQIVTTKLSASAPPGTSTYLPNGTLDFAFTGSITASTPYFHPGYAETTRYAQLNFFAIYIPEASSSDVGTCTAFLFKTNGSVIDTIAIGATTISKTASATSFSSFTVNLSYRSGETPDSAAVVFTSSGTKAQATYGSTLIVDDVTFSGIVAGVHEYSLLSGNMNAFPNPATESITLKTTNNSNQNLSLVEIFDITGRKTDAVLVQNNQTTLNTSAYAKGLYLYNAYNENHELMGVGKFTVAK